MHEDLDMGMALHGAVASQGKCHDFFMGRSSPATDKIPVCLHPHPKPQPKYILCLLVIHLQRIQVKWHAKVKW